MLLGAAAVLAGVGLMALAGYLISRCAEHPPVLSLTVVIVGVRAFGIARPLARYAERLVSHDLAFRVLARTRVTAVRLLAVRLPDRTGRDRDGDLLARLVGDIDATQNLFLRGLSPPLVALVSGAASVAAAAVLLPSAAVVLAAGMVAGGVLVPALAAALGAADGQRRAVVRAELTAELVELLQRRARARRARAPTGPRSTGSSGWTPSWSASAAGTRWPAGWSRASPCSSRGLTTAGVLAVSVWAHRATDRLDRVLVAALTLLAAAAFEAVAPLPPAALTLRSTLESARRAAGSRRPATGSLGSGAPGAGARCRPSGARRGASSSRTTPTAGGCAASTSPSPPATGWPCVGRSGSGKTTLAELLVRFLDPDEGQVALAGTDARELAQQRLRRRITLDGQDAYLFATSIRENVRLARARRRRRAVEAALRRARLGGGVARLPPGLDTLVGEDGAAVSGGERRRLALARALLADSAVLVLDEPTAHLDRATARALIEDVLGAAPDRTVLLITHREEEAALTRRVAAAAARRDHPRGHSFGMTPPRRPARSIGSRADPDRRRRTPMTTARATNAGSRSTARLLVGGAVLISVGAVIGMVGGLATSVAVIQAARTWVRQLDEPPSVTARRRLAQAKTAANAGAQGWRDHAMRLQAQTADVDSAG